MKIYLLKDALPLFLQVQLVSKLQKRMTYCNNIYNLRDFTLMKKPNFAAFAVVTSLFAALPSQASIISVGGDVPTEYRYTDCALACYGRFQQEYVSNNFGSTPLSITRVSFFFKGYADPWFWPTLSLQFSTKANGSGLSPTYASNMGTDSTSFSSAITSKDGNFGRVDFLGNFNYDPSVGNLLVDIKGMGYNGGSFAGTSEVADMLYSWNNADLSGRVMANYGLVTAFDTSVLVGGMPHTAAALRAPETVLAPAPGTVPEPASLALFGIALVGFGYCTRRKNV
jgi:hypothetical protein